MAKTTAASTVTLKLKLPESLADVYGERAAKRGRDAEDEIASHLAKTREYSSQTPIYLTDADRSTLSEIAGKQISTGADLIAWVRHLSTISVADVDIPLGELLLARLDGRRFGKTLPDLLKQVVVEQLESYTGLR